MGFVDGSHPCPAQHLVPSGESGVHYDPNTSVESNAFVVWKMHDKVIMQLITATLSPVALSCAIGSKSSQDIWTRLKEQFSTVFQTSIFQMKSNLSLRKAKDHLAVDGVYFPDEDIVILALNGLPPEYNTIRCVIRGRENVISLKEFRS
ncbi:uncharacterized protein [Pyrus communis]|uniref:uncharacterized protein n=1 Tax=Pyrus communis TaxID=23211 RepID=UPI0035BEC13E